MFHVTTFILHLTLTLLHVKVQGYPDTGCSSTYQVWRPDENVLYRIRELEYKCTNDTLDWMHHLQQLKSKIVFESLSTRNLTHHIERSLLEQKLEDVNIKMSVKDLRLELSAMENRNIEVRSLLERWRQELQNGQVGNVGQVSMDTVSSMVTRVDTLDGVLSTVKNGVGDLKAEWLLIKREVQSIRSENTELSTSQSALQTKAGTIRSAIEEIQADTAALKNEQTEIRALTNKLQSTVNNVRSGDLLIGQSDDNDGAASIASLNVRMQSVERQNSNIERSIHRMRTEAQQLRHDLYSLIASVNNGSVADLQEWLQLARIPLIEVPVLHLNHRPVNDVNGSHPRDCQDIFRRGYISSGVYQIKPDGMLQLDSVYCEMVNSTGWTVIHRRRDGSLSFNRRWLEYLHGFGNPYGEFWLGNKIISAITNQDNYKLRVDIWSWEGERAYAEYDFFRVDGEKFNFRLHVRGFSGNAGDSLSYHDTMAFSTEDNDNDMFRRNCAEENKGGWWFNDCYSSNLNGIYHTGFYSQGGEKHSYADGIVWFTWKETEFYSLKYVEMKIKPARD